MGQDMCVMTLCHRTGVKPDLDKALQFIANLTTLDIKDVNFDDYGWEDMNYGGDYDPTDLGAMLPLVQGRLRDCITAVFETLEWRDVTWITVAGWQCWLTGGMDGGTDSFEVWNRMWNDLGTIGWKVLNAAGFEDPPSEAEPFKIEEEATIGD